jgi:hypothetical protein
MMRLIEESLQKRTWTLEGFLKGKYLKAKFLIVSNVEQ